MNKNNDIKKGTILGAHMSTAGGYHQALIKGESIGCTTIQLFSKSNQTWYGKKITPEEIQLFKSTWEKSIISKNIMVHAAYLINLASSNLEIQVKSIKALIDELERCEALSIPLLILHPGSHTGSGIEEGVKSIVENLNKVFQKVQAPNVTLLLETMAGQGSSIGHTFENLALIREGVNNKAKIGVCLDLCHVFAAGYPLSTYEDYKNLWKHFDATIGMGNLKAIHLNDSKEAGGAKKDRHAKIGKGKIPGEIFKYIMNDHALNHVPKVLETPMVKSIEEYREEISYLRSLII